MFVVDDPFMALLSRYKEQHRHRPVFSRFLNGQSDSPKAHTGRKKKKGKKSGRKGKKDKTWAVHWPGPGEAPAAV